jgi:hypothetical protein
MTKDQIPMTKDQIPMTNDGTMSSIFLLPELLGLVIGRWSLVILP